MPDLRDPPDAARAVADEIALERRLASLHAGDQSACTQAEAPFIERVLRAEGGA